MMTFTDIFAVFAVRLRIICQDDFVCVHFSYGNYSIYRYEYIHVWTYKALHYPMRSKSHFHNFHLVSLFKFIKNKWAPWQIKSSSVLKVCNLKVHIIIIQMRRCELITKFISKHFGCNFQNNEVICDDKHEQNTNSVYKGSKNNIKPTRTITLFKFFLLGFYAKLALLC